MAHILVVGGTGLLRPLVKALIEIGNDVSVLATTASGFERLRLDITQMEQQRMHPCIVDYRNLEQLSQAVDLAIKERGALSTGIAWVHSDAIETDKIIFDDVYNDQPNFRYFKILGSSVDDPSRNSVDSNIQSQPLLSSNYRRVVLGFILEGETSRWLTNDEISQGIMEAIEKDQPQFTIGVTRPWSLRP
jgi:hypothetical protein